MVVSVEGPGWRPCARIFRTCPRMRVLRANEFLVRQSKKEIFYGECFRQLEAQHPNFSLHMVLWSPLDEDEWTGRTGFSHEVVLKKFPRKHPNPEATEYYLCGPTLMIKASNRMLKKLGVAERLISYDEL